MPHGGDSTTVWLDEGYRAEGQLESPLPWSEDSTLSAATADTARSGPGAAATPCRPSRIVSSKLRTSVSRHSDKQRIPSCEIDCPLKRPRSRAQTTDTWQAASRPWSGSQLPTGSRRLTPVLGLLGCAGGGQAATFMYDPSEADDGVEEERGRQSTGCPSLLLAEPSGSHGASGSHGTSSGSAGGRVSGSAGVRVTGTRASPGASRSHEDDDGCETPRVTLSPLTSVELEAEGLRTSFPLPLAPTQPQPHLC